VFQYKRERKREMIPKALKGVENKCHNQKGRRSSISYKDLHGGPCVRSNGGQWGSSHSFLN
jgi:hypothetical protein